jgi:hypothetical protein
VEGKSFRLADEVRYIQRRAADYDSRIVTIVSALGELRRDGMFLFASGSEMQIYGSRPRKCGASERLPGQRVEIFGEARTLDQR